MDALRVGAACAAAMLASAALAEPGTPAWVNARAWAGTPSRLPVVQLTFKGYRGDKVRFLVQAKRNGEQWTYYQDNIGSCPVETAQPDAVFRCAYAPVGGKPGNLHGTPGRDGYMMMFRNLDWNSEYCFRLLTQDEDGEYAKLWTGWACDRTNAAPPPLRAPYGVTITGVPAKRGDVDNDATPDRLWVTYVPDTGSVESWLEKSPALDNAAWARVPKSSPGKRGIVVDYALDQKPAYFRVCASNITGQACSAPHRFPPRGLGENAKADSGPRYEPQRPPVTNANARSGSTVTSPPPPVTATNAASAKSAPPPITSNAISRPGSSFDRGSGGLR